MGTHDRAALQDEQIRGDEDREPAQKTRDHTLHQGIQANDASEDDVLEPLYGVVRRHGIVHPVRAVGLIRRAQGVSA